MKPATLFTATMVSALLLSVHTAMAQPYHETSLFSQNMKMGTMMARTGCLQTAEHYFRNAIKMAEDNQAGELVDAELGLIDVLKFWRPAEAQRLNEHCQSSCKGDTERHLQHLFLNACINYKLNNRNAFNATYEDYWQLLRNNDSIAADGLEAVEAMHHALNGNVGEAKKALQMANTSIDPLLRSNLLIILYQQNAQLQNAIDELNHRTQIIDSLLALNYDDNIREISNTATMTTAQKQAEKQSSLLQNIILIMAGIIIAMLVVWIRLRRKAQKQLEEKNEQLRTALMMANETDHMKTEFVRRVSHEIRTPLNAITGFNDLLNNSEGMELPEADRAELVMQIKNNVKAITVIVNEMLQLAEAESTVEYEKNDTIACNKFFTDIVNSHSDEVPNSVALVYTTKVMNRFTVQTNAKALSDILNHMISNAIKFTSQGTIELNCAEKKGMIHLTLTDTGKGIPKDMQDNIFEHFAKGDAFKQGIGLGLTVSRNIAQRMGGDLKLDKQYTAGARFILSLPVK